MKHILIIIINLFVINQGICQGLTQTFTTDDYYIKYPEKWTVVENDMGAAFFLIAPKSNENDSFNENVNLIIQDLTGTQIDLDGYVQLSENQIKSTIKEGTIIRSERLKSGSWEIQKIVYTGEINGFKLKLIQQCWVRNSKAYVLTFTAEQTAFEQYKLYGQQILNSFRFK